MNSLLIENATIVNEGKKFNGSIIIKDGKIAKIFQDEIPKNILDNITIINGEGKFLLPGIIDDHVHFREPGLTYKADIYTESKAAISGGITSFMEMPNTEPQTITQELLEEKYRIASKTSLANFSFYIGATNNNIEELLKTNPKNVCGIKIFMGSSTGNMLVDKKEVLSRIFSQSPLLIAVHCEDESIIQNNIEQFKNKYGQKVSIKYHPRIRNEEACYKSSSYAVELAKKYNTLLHLLHLSCAKELKLLENTLPAKEKQITAEVCIHHLWFEENDYEKLGTRIKWNPAIKTKHDKAELLKGVLNNKIDIIATDHAPHTFEEKKRTYFKAPSGGPLVQHSLVAMLELYHQQKISLEKIVEKMCHTPADIFHINKKGYIREGYWADIVIVDLKNKWKVTKDNILYKCKWSPFEGQTFNSKITHTFVNGNLVYKKGIFYESVKGMRLLFDR